jgi:hypothetical protein
VKDHSGMGITASLACSHVKGKVQWVECCATTGKGEWHITGNVQEGTRGSVLVARTWVRKNAAEIMARLRMRGAAPRVELCSMRGLGREWQLLSPAHLLQHRSLREHAPHHAHHDQPHHSQQQARTALPALLNAAVRPSASCSSASAASAATATLVANGSSAGSGGSSGSGTSSCCSSPARTSATRRHGGKGGGVGGGGGVMAMQQDLGLGDGSVGDLVGLGLGLGLPSSCLPLAVGGPLASSIAVGGAPAVPNPLLDVHVHLPETEVAKDVSINGAAAAVSMIAVMTGLPVRPDVAVLGEITLAGVLWPLEQVNEAEVKTAIDARISHLILPMDNVRQIEKVPKEMRRGLRVTGAVRLMDVIDQLFVLEGSEVGEDEDEDEDEDEEDGSQAAAAAFVGGEEGAQGHEGEGLGVVAMAMDSGSGGGGGSGGGEGGPMARELSSGSGKGGGGKSER